MMFMISSEFMICDFLYSIFDNTFYVVFMIILHLLSLHISVLEVHLLLLHKESLDKFYFNITFNVLERGFVIIFMYF